VSASPVQLDPDHHADPGAVLRQLREERGHNLRGLALLSGVDHVTLHNLERNRQRPTLETLLALARVYHMRADRLADLLGVDLGQLSRRRRDAS
jgi:transcriptional regulator with XRE-family HTH domain